MPLTHRPHGLTVCSTTALVYNSAAGDGDLDCNRLFTAGTASIASINLTLGGTAGTNLIGERAYINGTFTSAAGTTYLATPINGNIVDVITTADTTPRTCSAFTLRAGTAGTVYVASVALAFATAAGQQVRPALTSAAITTASALQIVVTTAGSAANFSYTVVIEKSA